MRLPSQSPFYPRQAASRRVKGPEPGLARRHQELVVSARGATSGSSGAIRFTVWSGAVAMLTTKGVALLLLVLTAAGALLVRAGRREVMLLPVRARRREAPML